MSPSPDRPFNSVQNDCFWMGVIKFPHTNITIQSRPWMLRSCPLSTADLGRLNAEA